MSSLADIYHSQDILSHVFSFLPLDTIAMMERSCKYFAELLRADFVDRTIYYDTICRLFKIVPNMNFNEFLKGENCRELLKEFYNTPFVGKYENENYDHFAAIEKYSSKGGVIDFFIYVPCKLLKGLLKYHRIDLSEDFKRTLHKFMLIAGSLFWELSCDSKFRIGIPEREVMFHFKDKYYTSESFPFTEYSMGKGLILMLDNFKEIESKHSIAISASGTEDGVAFYCGRIRDAQPIELWDDIFAKCSNPPYGFEDAATDEIAELTKELYNDHDGSCEHYSWDDYIFDS